MMMNTLIALTQYKESNIFICGNICSHIVVLLSWQSHCDRSVESF